MTRSRTIRSRLLGDQVLLILIFGGALMATTFFGAGRAVQALSKSVIERALDQTETELHRFFDPLSASLAVLRSWDQSEDLLAREVDLLRDLVGPLAERMPQISGVLVADHLGTERFAARIDGVWRLRETREGRMEWLDAEVLPPRLAEQMASGGYDPRQRPWYTGAVAAAGSLHWTAPYLFFSQQSEGMTAALAYLSLEGHQRVVAIDVTLEDLVDYSREISVSPRGSVWITTADRMLLAWPDDPAIWGSRDPSDALLELPPDLGLQLVDDASKLLASREEPEVPARFSSGGEQWWAAGRNFELAADRPLQMAVLVPRDDLLTDRERLRWWIAGVTLVVLTAAVWRARVLAGRFSRPIEALAGESDRISQGDLEPGEAIASSLEEVQRLADAHERMRGGLKTLVKLEGDLEVARMIQQRTFPTELPNLAGFDVCGWSRPADETGGDSYDVIGLTADDTLTDGDADRLVLLLADATGHGVGPALSVTQLRAMVRMAVRGGDTDFAESVRQMNEQLYADLPQNRFITAWIAVLEADGSLTSYSGGQAPLLLYRASSQSVEVLNSDAPPMGLLPPMPVVLKPPLALEPGDIYVVLSDGFYEAADDTGEEFEKERVIEIVERTAHLTSAEILAALRDGVNGFIGGAPLSDDRTAVIIKRA
jgi:serine phosphatase RsbU (regulator of sigma subunit)